MRQQVFDNNTSPRRTAADICVRENERGYVTLLSVLIGGTVTTAIAVTLLLLGIASSRTVLALQNSNEAKAFAYACAEEALGRIRMSSAFSGTGNFVFGRGTCSYAVLTTGGQGRVVQATGIAGVAVRKVEVIVNQIRPAIVAGSWQEVVDF